MAAAPTHCKPAIFSLGSNNEALNIATTTSDIVRIPTRPGNSICDTLNMTIKPGNITTTDQTSAVGNASLNRLNAGAGSAATTPAKNADSIVVHKKINAASGSTGIEDQRLSTAIPKAQKIPDSRL